ncbi:glycine zipper 2TM domain-containing protein [Ramlibacter sp. WS9]|uniref:glycine zipper 2TM domain-containing protein n=1 Tax=Ramlibacter sp. WS9 TaxID=1882741 RepID=UPI001144FF3E|nr:glycine zipper 2TM domain-containing protein [Ramlibacter sp. WS9]ROZ62556.1 glycine zipper 2TM domain-containing protein [Ramlibacter sp. WS9]
MIKTTRFTALAASLAAAAALTACGTVDPYGPNNYPVASNSPTVDNRVYPAGQYPYGQYPVQTVGVVEFGRVQNVTMISGGAPSYQPNRSAAGGIIGAVIGGVLGNQIGSGGGRAAATVLGATAGAVIGANAGNRVSPNAYNNQYPVYRVTVQTDQGAWRTYDVNATGDLRPGDRVRIENGVIFLA